MATIALIVFDEEGGSTFASFVLTVNPVNDSPTLEAISHIIVYEGGGPKTLGLTGIGSGGLVKSKFWRSSSVQIIRV